MKSSLTIRSAIGAGATIANLLTGTDFEFMSGAQVMSILGNGDIVGMNHQLRYTVNGTPINPIPPSALNLGSTVGTVKADEDLIIAGLALPAQSRLVHAITNPGAASNVTMRYMLE